MILKIMLNSKHSRCVHFRTFCEGFIFYPLYFAIYTLYPVFCLCPLFSILSSLSYPSVLGPALLSLVFNPLFSKLTNSSKHSGHNRRIVLSLSVLLTCPTAEILECPIKREIEIERLHIVFIKNPNQVSYFMDFWIFTYFQ